MNKKFKEIIEECKRENLPLELLIKVLESNNITYKKEELEEIYND